MDFDAAESQAKDSYIMRLLIDGYNLMFQSVVVNSKKDGKNALRIARGRLMEQLIALLEPEERNQTTIVFDANNAPPGLPERCSQQGIQLIFARDWASADELIQLYPPTMRSIKKQSLVAPVCWTAIIGWRNDSSCYRTVFNNLKIQNHRRSKKSNADYPNKSEINGFAISDYNLYVGSTESTSIRSVSNWFSNPVQFGIDRKSILV
jgi:hypothetical protein